MKSTTLTYKNYTLPIVEESGVQWVTSTAVAQALGYPSAERISQIYRRRKDEFTPAMSTILKLKGVETRVFTLRGVHLICMFSGTKLAMGFRRWLLDILEGDATPQPTTEVSSTLAQAQPDAWIEPQMARVTSPYHPPMVKRIPLAPHAALDLIEQRSVVLNTLLSATLIRTAPGEANGYQRSIGGHCQQLLRDMEAAVRDIRQAV